MKRYQIVQLLSFDTKWYSMSETLLFVPEIIFWIRSHQAVTLEYPQHHKRHYYT